MEVVDLAILAVEEYFKSKEWDGSYEDAVQYAVYVLAAIAIYMKTNRKKTLSTRDLPKILALPGSLINEGIVANEELLTLVAVAFVECLQPEWFSRATVQADTVRAAKA